MIQPKFGNDTKGAKAGHHLVTHAVFLGFMLHEHPPRFILLRTRCSLVDVRRPGGLAIDKVVTGWNAHSR